MDLSIIIPCYNEADNIANLRDQMEPVIGMLSAKGTIEIILVDDGSSDHTWERFGEVFSPGSQFPAPVRFERHAVNLGLGAAIRTGFQASRGEIVVTTDSDGTYRFDTIPRLLSYLTPEVDLVTASPYHPEGEVAGVPGYRLVLSKGSSLIYRLLLGGQVHTYTALFRAYRRRVIQCVSFEANGFLAGTEILVNSLLMGYQAAEFATILHARTVGVSKAKLARTIRAHLKFQGKILLHQLGLKKIAVQPAVGKPGQR